MRYRHIGWLAPNGAVYATCDDVADVPVYVRSGDYEAIPADLIDAEPRDAIDADGTIRRVSS